MGVKEHKLLNSGHGVLTEQDKMILDCAAEAKISKPQWELVLGKVGAEAMGFFLEALPSGHPFSGARLLNQPQQLFFRLAVLEIIPLC